MSEAEAVKEFKAGLEYLGSNYAQKALPHFTRAAELDKANPFYLSYMGLALAAGEQKWNEAEEICLSAVRMKRTQAELYLNLAQVYRLAGKKEDAVETLRTGLQLTKQDPRLGAALSKYGVRRQPVLSFLPRDHYFNRELGRLRYRILKSFGKSA